MTIVDEAMARLRRDRPEMSPQSVEYVEGLLRNVVIEAAQAAISIKHNMSRLGPSVELVDPTAPSDPAGSSVPSDPSKPRSLHEVALKHGLEPPYDLFKCLAAMMAETEARSAKKQARTAPSDPAGPPVPSDP